MSTLPARPFRAPIRFRGSWSAAVAVIIAALLLAAFALDGPGDGVSGGDHQLPNPMGGPVREAPGGTSGQIEVGGLEVADSMVEMGSIALGVTYVPGWQLANTTGGDLAVTVGQPQVLEGCCPGPIYVDGVQVEPGQVVTVPAGGQSLLQFPLQMHPGMDGWHHLAVPLEVEGEAAVLQVTGDFSDQVPT